MKYKTLLTAAVLGLTVTAGAQAGFGHGGMRDFAVEKFRSVDTDGNGLISKPEFDAERAGKFAAADADHSGGLNQDEMQAMRDARRDEWRQAFQDEMFSRMDADGNGLISAEEYSASTGKMFARIDANDDGVLEPGEGRRGPGGPGGWHGKGDGPRDGKGMGMRDGPRDGHGMRDGKGPHGMFQDADSDGDGTISRAEFDAKATERFAAADADDNGSLTRDEAAALHPGRPDGGKGGKWGAHRGERMFEYADVDGNGEIDAQEFAAMGNQRFAKMDDNGDGNLGPDEMKPHRGHHKKGGWGDGPRRGGWDGPDGPEDGPQPE